MSVLAVVNEGVPLDAFVTWAAAIADAKRQPLTILCWTYSPTVSFPLLAAPEDLAPNEKLVEQTRERLGQIAASGKCKLDPNEVEIRPAMGPEPQSATLAEIRSGDHDLVIVSADNDTPEATRHAGQIQNSLLRKSPCETIVLSRLPSAPKKTRRILVVANDSPHDGVAFETFCDAAQADEIRLTLARLEDEAGDEASELGRREVKRLMRSAGLKSNAKIRRKVYSPNNWGEYLRSADEQDLIILGANQESLLSELVQCTSRPTFAVIRRAPPLKRLTKVGSGRWKTRLTPSDYADMMQGLRRGAVLNSDFLVMLGLAAAIATLGLIQNSAAVVIGSMLLAPLMTPMIACGLAIAQGNKKLGRKSMMSIGVGFLLTLLVSFTLALFTPGEELTPQIISRGNPNILDLLVALFSAAAASYALAHPSVVGAIAGVAIATALVPPLCSAGISLAYRQYLNAHGAAVLFATNLVAIIIGAAITFRLLGITLERSNAIQRRWVYRICTAIGVALIALAYPLQLRLQERIDQGQTQPRTYPLTQATEQALSNFLLPYAEVQLVSSGRPSALHDLADVVLVVSSTQPLSKAFSDEMAEICREQMGDPDLAVKVHCFLDAWEHEEPANGEVIDEKKVIEPIPPQTPPDDDTSEDEADPDE